jgi:hypothetical protein
MCQDWKIVGVSERPIYSYSVSCHKSETRHTKQTKARRVSVQERIRHHVALSLLSPSSKSQTAVSGIVTGNIYCSEN